MSAEDAIRDYEFDARKQLYKQFEPLLFLLVENCESAYVRICELARTAREGNLDTDSGWLKDNGYFKTSTIHKLLLPLVVFRLMQKNLTIFDLDLVPSYKAHYLLAKGLYSTFADDYELARSPPALEYDPAEEGSKEYQENTIKADPARHRRQGVYRGLIDRLVDALIVTQSDGITRLLSYGEFHEKYFRSIVHEPFEIMANLFDNFHPRTSPVLWRILIAQAHFHLAIKRTRDLNLVVADIKTLKVIPEEERIRLFDWRHNAVVPTDEVLIDPFTAVGYYLRRGGLAQFMESNAIS